MDPGPGRPSGWARSGRPRRARRDGRILLAEAQDASARDAADPEEEFKVSDLKSNFHLQNIYDSSRTVRAVLFSHFPFQKFAAPECLKAV